MLDNALAPISLPALRERPDYLAVRNAVILRVESFYPRVYLDTLGIPTISIGVNLLPKGMNGQVAIAKPRVAIIEQQVSKTLTLFRSQLQALADIINSTPAPQNITKLSQLRATARGQATQKLLRLATKKTPAGDAYVFEVLDWAEQGIELTPAQSTYLVNALADSYENRLDQRLKNVQFNPETLNVNQRAALFAMEWHGKGTYTVKIAQGMAQTGTTPAQVTQLFTDAAGNNPAFVQRQQVLASVVTGSLNPTTLAGYVAPPTLA